MTEFHIGKMKVVDTPSVDAFFEKKFRDLAHEWSEIEIINEYDLTECHSGINSKWYWLWYRESAENDRYIVINDKVFEIIDYCYNDLPKVTINQVSETEYTYVALFRTSDYTCLTDVLANNMESRGNI